MNKIESTLHKNGEVKAKKTDDFLCLFRTKFSTRRGQDGKDCDFHSLLTFCVLES